MKMHISEALDFIDGYSNDNVVGPCYALAFAIGHTPSMWDHTDNEVPGVTFCRFNKYTILIEDHVHGTQFLLRCYGDGDDAEYSLQGIDFNAYAESSEGPKYVEAISTIAEYACAL